MSGSPRPKDGGPRPGTAARLVHPHQGRGRPAPLREPGAPPGGVWHSTEYHASLDAELPGDTISIFIPPEWRLVWPARARRDWRPP
jgi:hypothetical protein